MTDQKRTGSGAEHYSDNEMTMYYITDVAFWSGTFNPHLLENKMQTKAKS